MSRRSCRETHRGSLLCGGRVGRGRSLETRNQCNIQLSCVLGVSDPFPSFSVTGLSFFSSCGGKGEIFAFLPSLLAFVCFLRTCISFGCLEFQGKVCGSLQFLPATTTESKGKREKESTLHNDTVLFLCFFCFFLCPLLPFASYNLGSNFGILSPFDMYGR